LDIPDDPVFDDGDESPTIVGPVLLNDAGESVRDPESVLSKFVLADDPKNKSLAVGLAFGAALK
jgi:hypothetical protein